MTAYYNEIDECAVNVLHALIDEGVIAPGEVDSRSIKEVSPNDLAGFTQCHFFAGAGLWSVAARLAEWPDNLPLWTGSCPCQGESLAGKRLGANDPRDLWPDFHRLIRARRPLVVVGEQVAAAAGTHWLDRTCADLDADGYAARAVDIPACAVDAPNQRQRLYWAAVDASGTVNLGDGEREGLEGQRGDGDGSGRWPGSPRSTATSDGQLHADPEQSGRGRRPLDEEWRAWRRIAAQGTDGGLFSHAAGDGRQQGRASIAPARYGQSTSATDGRNGTFWSDAEWLISPEDGKARRAKPGIPFLVDGLAGRIPAWRLVGNSIVPQLAAEALAALKETLIGSTSVEYDHGPGSCVFL